MPRVEAGWIVIDLPSISRAGPKRVLSIIRGEEVVLVTRPSVVTVRGPRGPLTVALSPGSVISPEPLELSEGEGWALTRPEWVEGCWSTSGGEGVRVKSGGDIVEDRITAINYNDPLGLLVNGKVLRASITRVPEDSIPIATVRGNSVLWRVEGVYETSISGDALLLDLLDFTAILYTDCRGR